ncbi:phosphatidylinositol-specific phospholipase C domain-containing protein [Methylococcus sp. EFPC2]|uniref:phosphatidylinositol-specific phospholipase C domain-containing protein n=1 Tax=Methylococcus sp. EFPC2 TaxID=2812648 RepID=UPI001967F9D8|nr:phosphatidylinositol-specific phospholipase C domain-containing protein [Methylococcus sp. EFPC2]QSA97527.1 hypothetical protein JWZ97_01380 [Methylococcus sp. EFPC2]
MSAYVGARNPDWMAALPDERRLSGLSVPATHDSMALYGGDLAQTQSMSLMTQLMAGIRGIDIRCQHMNNSCLIFHGPIYQRVSLSQVLITLKTFLVQHPK